MNRESVEEQYKFYKNEYDLPALRHLESVINTKVNQNPVIKQLLEDMSITLSKYLKQLHGIIEPQNYAQIMESEFYTHKRKEHLHDKYAEIMVLVHKINAGLCSHESDQVKVLKTSLETFETIKKYMKNLSARHARKWVEQERGKHSHYG